MAKADDKLKEHKSKHTGNDVERILDSCKGYFNSEAQLQAKYPDGDSGLVGGEYAFVDDENVGIFMFEYTPVRNKWVRDASINFISEEELSEGIVLKTYATLTPSQGDIRFRKNGHKVIVESFDTSEWKIITTIGSVTTDTFNMESDQDNSMVGFNDIVGGVYSSLIKHRVSVNQSKGEFINDFGSLERPLVLSSRIPIVQSTPTETKKIIVNGQGTSEFPVGHYKFMFKSASNIEFDTADFNVKQPTRARMWIVEQISNTMAYESQTRRDAIDTKGTLIIDDKTEATTGLISATFPRIGSLCEGVEYEIHMEIFEGVMYGDSDFITFAINGQSWTDANLITSKNVMDILNGGFTMATDSAVMGRGSATDAEPEGQAKILAITREDASYLGDTTYPTIINSSKKLQVGIEGERPRNIATEDYAVSVSNLEKVFDARELDRDQTGLLIQTEGKTYTMYDEDDFPKYTTYNYLASFGLSFRINKTLTHQILFMGGDSSATILELADGVAILNSGYYDENEMPQVITFDLSNVSKPPKGWTFPEKPYLPDTDLNLEFKKEWRFDSTIIDNILTTTLIDPNGGVWQAVVDKVPFLSSSNPFVFGQEASDKLGRMWDVNITMRDSTKPDCKWLTENIYQGEMKKASLVTRHRKAIADVSDKMAIHKYKEETKDFHTFFNDSVSGIYRCFGMEENIPLGYIIGDNDFYVNVYAVSQYYKSLDALDIRSGRKFIKVMYSGTWRDWIETGGTGSIPLVPKSVYKNRDAKRGGADALSLAELGIVRGDKIMISSGTRGMAVECTTVEEITNYASGYFVSFDDDELIIYITDEGTAPCSLEIFKYSPVEVTPPKPWKPYLNLKNVADDITNGTLQGTLISMDIFVVSWELVRIPFVVLTLPLGEERVPLMFDDKGHYYFEFPFDCDGRFASGDVVKYHLVWDDQLGGQYTGDEVITKNILL